MEGGGQIPLDAAGDAAEPVVDHAWACLEIRHELDTPMVRLLDLVRNSNLEGETREWADQRLEQASASQRMVRSALETHFGDSTDETRKRVAELLSRVHAALVGGSADGSLWRVADESVAVAPSASVRGAVDALIGALVGEQRADATVGLIRQLHLSVLLDDEEEGEEDETVIGIPADDRT